MLDQLRENDSGCPACATGILPECGMLAVGYVPTQRNAEHRYEADKALARGTLFPGLDLPYLGMVNQDVAAPGPLKELMAVGFAVQELGLYLDTHRGDREALELFQKYRQLYEDGTKEYQRRYGPLQMTGTEGDAFDWVDDPWPWDGRCPQPRGSRFPAALKEV